MADAEGIDPGGQREVGKNRCDNRWQRHGTCFIKEALHKLWLTSGR